MAVMLSDLLRNLTFNRSAHCTQVSDQCPLGLLYGYSEKPTHLVAFNDTLGIRGTPMKNNNVNLSLYLYFVIKRFSTRAQWSSDPCLLHRVL